MTRDTSIVNYHELVASGKLKGLQLAVLTDVYHWPGTTQGETARRITSGINTREYSVRPRFAELMAKGLLAEGPARQCRTTGKSSITFYFNESMIATKKVKKPTLLTVVKALEKIAESRGELSEKAKIALDMIDRVV